MANPRDRSLVLPLRFGRPGGFHFVRPPLHGMPVGLGALSDIDPTGVDLPTIVRPPLYFPPGVSSSTCPLADDCDTSICYRFSVGAVTGTTGCAAKFNGRVFNLRYGTSPLSGNSTWYRSYVIGSSGTCTGNHTIVCEIRDIGGKFGVALGIVGLGDFATYDCDCFDCATGGTFNLISATAGTWQTTRTMTVETCCYQPFECNTSYQYQFALAGVSGIPACCPTWNRTWTMSWNASPPVHYETVAFSGGGSCGNTHAHVQMSSSTGACNTALTFATNTGGIGGSVVAQYSLNSNFDCLGSNVFTRSSVTGNCSTGWPTILTVSKV
jgi:hypothetical protein